MYKKPNKVYSLLCFSDWVLTLYSSLVMWWLAKKFEHRVSWKMLSQPILLQLGMYVTIGLPAIFKGSVIWIINQILGSCEFQWSGFHSCDFSKNSPNIQLMWFSQHPYTPQSHLLTLDDLIWDTLYEWTFCLKNKQKKG